MKLASALYSGTYPFVEAGVFTTCKIVRLPDDLKRDSFDALVVWGGADISPSLYNHKVHQMTNASDKLSERDTTEWCLMLAAKEAGIPIIGICRGAQMLCALAGGSLYQHVDNHGVGGGHRVQTFDGMSLIVSSVHHQMMNVDGTVHEMRMWSDNRSQRYITEKGDVGAPPVDPEYVYFPEVKGHAIQWHPEFMSVDCGANLWLYEILKEDLAHED